MFGPIIESLDWLRSHGPRSIVKKRNLNFITIHYLYIISATIVGSILLYPAGGLPYIDALFFASGAATQSGLNPVDVNNINTYQQVILYLMAMICNPIFINTFVVFVRLYWFERRFQGIAREARKLRRTKSRTRTEAKDDRDPDVAERGIRGRSIVVLHNGDVLPSKVGQALETEKLDASKDISDESRTESSTSQRDTTDNTDHAVSLPTQQPPSFHRDITFADEVKGSSGEDRPVMLPKSLSPEEHISFLENQRNPKDKGALRIPGPRDFDRGSVPEPLDDEIADAQLTNQPSDPLDTKESANEEHVRRNVTIDEPNHPRLRTAAHTMSKLSTRRSGTLEKPRSAPTGDTNGHPSRLRVRTGTFPSLREKGSRDHEPPPTPYLSWQPTIQRNSNFADMTEAQREELGGIEYRSLKTLAVVLVSYFVLFHLLGVVVLLPWIVCTDTWGSIVDGYGLSRVWWGIFTPQTFFNDLGFTLTPDSMVSFQEAVLPLLFGSFLIVIGNTGFPCMLRFAIWIASKVVHRHGGLWDEFRFLLDHPRRCFTLLFPGKATWWLFWILVFLNGIDVIFFVVLDLHDPTVTEINPVGVRVLNGLFQAVSTRTAGTSSVSLADLHPGIQVSYLVMMYISVFPIAISIRRTNVYEERSLGVYGSVAEQEQDDKEPSYVGAHLRRQLSFDLWYIFLGLFIIAVAEGQRIGNAKQYAFTIFSVLFEIVSAYGTVGLSLGYPDFDTSFSGQFKVISKLVIIAMQIRGRHRGLPYSLDRAILLPSESLQKKEIEDTALRMQRRNSSLSNMGGPHVASRTPTTGPTPASTFPHTATASGRDLDGVAEEDETSRTSHSKHARKDIGKAMAELANLTTFKSRKEAEHDK